MKILFFHLALCCVNCCFGQYNLVPNGSFEDVPSCPNYCVAINCAPPWENPTEFGSPDLFNYCNQSWLQFIMQAQNPHTGNSFAGFYTGEQYTNNPSIFDAREYIQTELLDTLHAEHYYLVEYYLSLAEWGRYATNNVGVHFSDTAIYRSGIGHEFMLLDYPEQILPFGNPVILDTTDNAWYKVQGLYYATGTEKFITIGNFNSDSETTFLAYNPHDISPIGMGDEAYYYIDDVSVVPLDSIPDGLPVDAGPDQTIYIQDSVFIGQKIANLNCNWYELGGNQLASNISGLYVQPLQTTTYVVEQILGSDISYDTCTVFVEGLGLEEEEMLSFSIYPNPNKGTFSVYLKQAQTNLTDMYVLDSQGRKVIQKLVPAFSKKCFLQTDLAPGVYFIKFSNGNNSTEIKRVVVE
jgi:hypothetical protein